jgi:deazaflavin-dependent oxidoreductase (nitroreductase family)
MSAFPDVRWGSSTSSLRRPLMRFSATRAGAWLIRTLTPVDRWLLLRSAGRYTVLGPFAVPILLLTTTGARSGQPRTTPLLCARDGDDLVVVGSNFGQQRHPQWSTNLLAHPEAVVTIGGRPVRARATLLGGAEAERGYALMTEVATTYATYQERTDRSIRVFRLTATT